jgi:pyrroloquinoline quinone (PQQ) biosynthesis protein C
MERVHLAKPKLRREVEIDLVDAGAVLSLGEASCGLEFPLEAREAVRAMLAALRCGGRSVDDLLDDHPELGGLPEILSELDGARLLTESEYPVPAKVVSGAQLQREVRRICDRMKLRVASSRFVDALESGEATAQQLIGYALEYFWLVRAAPGLIAPALATATDDRKRRLLQAFLASELNHDDYLAKALDAVGIDRGGLANLQPLPATFAVCASLGVYAHQHPLSFYSALFLFEEPRDRFVTAFEGRCRELGLPEAFYEPFRWHAQLNDEAEHEEISEALLRSVPVVDAETQTVVKRNVSVLLESLLRQEIEIVEYYGDGSQPCARIFS